MSDDIELLIEPPELEPQPHRPASNLDNEKKGIWNYLAIYKMPRLTEEQLSGFSKYKVCQL